MSKCDALLELNEATAPAVARGILLIETRAHPQLKHLLKQCRRVFPDWPVQFFASKAAAEEVMRDVEIGDAIRTRDIHIYDLPFESMTVPDYNEIMLSAAFYERVLFDVFLVVQTDAMLCSMSTRSIEEFVGYDYVGAPWHSKEHRDKDGGNGGLSLRSRRGMIRALSEEPYGDATFQEPEDVYFSTRKCIRVAPRAVAMRFSAEQTASADVIGVHKPWNALSVTSMKGMARTCPGLDVLLCNNGKEKEGAEVATAVAVAGRSSKGGAGRLRFVNTGFSAMPGDDVEYTRGVRLVRRGSRR